MRREYLLVALAGILSGTIVFGGKVLSDHGLSAYEISVIPYAVPILIIAPFVLSKRQYLPEWRQLPLWVLSGIVCATTVVSEFSAVILGVPVAIVVLLLYSQPIWTVILSTAFLKEKLLPKDIIACIIVLLGILVLVDPFGARITDFSGIFVALLGGIGLSGWVVIGSYASKKGIHPITIKFAESASQMFFVLISLPLVGLLFTNPGITSFSFNYSTEILAALLLFGLVSVTLVPIIYFMGVQKVPTVQAGIILLLEPVAAAILSAAFLNQPITLNIVVGGALIILANILIIHEVYRPLKKKALIPLHP